MRFSIAIPVFRQAEFLPTALESLRAQEAALQLAVMDATPDDSVQRVLDGYRDLLHYHRHGPDAGQTAAIQEGWDHTDGDIIAWLCADDYYFPGALDTVETVFKSQPDVDVIYGDAVFTDEAGKFLGYFPEIDRDMSAITRGCCIAQPSCFVRRSAFAKIGRLNPDLHYIMDWDLWTRLYKAGAQFHYLNQPLSVARMYPGTKTGSRSWRRLSEIGRHLWQHAPLPVMLRALAGFYHQDLKSSEVGGIERGVLWALESLRRRKHCQGPPVERAGLSRYGLSRYQNQAGERVDIFLPWYGAAPPAKVRVNCDLEAAPGVLLNGQRAEWEAGSSFEYALPPLAALSQLLHLRLSAPAGRAWHLRDVEFE